MTLLNLQEELDQPLLVNDTRYGTIEVLLEKTEDLERSIRDVLTARLKRIRSESHHSSCASSKIARHSKGVRIVKMGKSQERHRLLMEFEM